MRDPFSWALPLGRIWGINIRVHFLFFIFVLAMWLRAAIPSTSETIPPWPDGSALAVLILMGLIFVSVLLHEFGHCFAARSVDGDAKDILMWPLGGLAFCDLPHNPRAHFITAAGGPAVNLLLCLVSGGVLLAFQFVPPFNPFATNAFFVPELWNWSGEWSLYRQNFPKVWSEEHLLDRPILPYWQVLVAQFFLVNFVQLLINVLLMGFPLDGGQMLQATLWPRMGYRQSMLTAIFVGFIVMFIVGIAGLVMNEVLVLALAAFIYFSCRNQWVLLETGAEDTFLGYDFSQGYTSLERDEEHLQQVKKRQPNFIQRWMHRRAERKRQREEERTRAEETRVDELLQKIQEQGQDSLTEEERRFLEKVSRRYGKN
ncbi:MAG: site-2 protease family protein [Gemmataceae bacterium]